MRSHLLSPHRRLTHTNTINVNDMYKENYFDIIEPSYHFKCK